MAAETTATSATNAVTLATYQATAELYARRRPATVPAELLALIDELAARAPAGASILEIGSGTGHDAALLEQRGLRVQRSDATSAFVERLRSQGVAADLLNVLTDELGGPWDAIYADAVFLHLSAEELRAALAKTAAAVTADGLLAFTLKEGDGSAWTTAKLNRPRHFTYWREAALRSLIDRSPWRLLALTHAKGASDDWLHCLCAAGDSGGLRR